MCGILACFSSTAPETAIRLLSRRGPDSSGRVPLGWVTLEAHVLSMQRGHAEQQQQPLKRGRDGAVIAFNGELYGLSDGVTDSEWLVDRMGSDSARVVSGGMGGISIENGIGGININAIPIGSRNDGISIDSGVGGIPIESGNKSSIDGGIPNDSCGATQSVKRIGSTLLDGMDQLEQVEGEWAVIIANENEVVYGRDRFGRRSLLEARDASTGKLRFLASVAWKDDSLEWREVPVATLFAVGRDLGVREIPRPNIVRVPRPIGNEKTWERVLGALEHAVARRIDMGTLGMSRRFAILFSGGIDSVLIAALAHRVMKDSGMVIPLVNVSFQGEESPDRIASREALIELQQIYPSRKWEFIAVNPTVNDVAADESDIVAHITPKVTVMDFNIGSVLWFGSKQSPSDCRALLTGLGADELCGGYGRHKTASLKGGKEALENELKLDLSRMWTRNLGRDDRCVAAHGKELRAPFLDQEVMDVIFTSPLEDLVDFSSTSEGRGDKLVLRRLMKELGMPLSAEREKRAAQFGSRMSKLVRSGRSGKDEFHSSALALDGENGV